ncbi:MAG: hypothetical protein ACRDQ1_18450, partial [Sciscionella sp.]
VVLCLELRRSLPDQLGEVAGRGVQPPIDLIEHVNGQATEHVDDGGTVREDNVERRVLDGLKLGPPAAVWLASTTTMKPPARSRSTRRSSSRPPVTLTSGIPLITGVGSSR